MGTETKFEIKVKFTEHQLYDIASGKFKNHEFYFNSRKKSILSNLHFDHTHNTLEGYGQLKNHENTIELFHKLIKDIGAEIIVFKSKHENTDEWKYFE